MGRLKDAPQSGKIISIGDFCESIKAKPERQPETIEDETGMTLRHLLKDLDANQKAVIRGRFIKGKKLKEIGEELGLTKERIRQIQVEALESIQAKLGIGKDGSPE